MHLLRNKLVKSQRIFLAFPYCRPLPKGQWAVAYVRATNYHKLILMQATAETVMGGGFQCNSVSELKLKNRCTGSTFMPTFVLFVPALLPSCTLCALHIYSCAHSYTFCTHSCQLLCSLCLPFYPLVPFTSTLVITLTPFAPILAPFMSFVPLMSLVDYKYWCVDKILSFGLWPLKR